MRNLAFVVLAGCTSPSPSPTLTTAASFQFLDDPAPPPTGASSRLVAQSAFGVRTCDSNSGVIVFSDSPPGTDCTKVEHWIARLALEQIDDATYDPPLVCPVDTDVATGLLQWGLQLSDRRTLGAGGYDARNEPYPDPVHSVQIDASGVADDPVADPQSELAGHFSIAGTTTFPTVYGAFDVEFCNLDPEVRVDSLDP